MSEIVLRNFQKQLLDELKDEKAIGIFSKTGSGKTYMSLFRFLENPTPNLLVICPPHVIGQWEENILNVVDIDIPKLKKSSTAKDKDKEYAKYKGANGVAIVVSLSTVRNLPSLFGVIDETWTIIVDESHRIKDLGSPRKPVQVTRAVLNLGTRTPWKIILTATPTQKIKGGYIDLYTQLKFLGKITMSVRQFKTRYCIEEQIFSAATPFPVFEIIGYRPEIIEIINIAEECTRSYEPKYTEEEPNHVQIKLPRVRNYAKVNRERFYNEEMSLDSPTSLRIALKTLTGGIVHGNDIYGKHIQFKDNTVKTDWLKGFLEDTDEVVFVLYQYNAELNALTEMLDKQGKTYIVLNGANKDKVGSIRAGGYDVVLGQIDACGESLDGLQYITHICVYYSMPESSVAYRQTLGRIYRDGQTVAPTYYYLTMEGTIDDLIYKMTNSKVEYTQQLIDRLVIGG